MFLEGTIMAPPTITPFSEPVALVFAMDCAVVSETEIAEIASINAPAVINFFIIGVEVIITLL
jgi:hypothetical protein